MLRKTLLGLLLALVAVQFFRPARNSSASSGPNDISVRFPPPPEVRVLLERACYDCHSNHTRYPWYAEVQPLGWWLASHIREGKRHLNFSEFATYPPERAARRLDHAIDEITEGGMPLPSYKLIHTDARLTEAQVKTLTAWLEATRQSLAPRETKSP